MLEPGIEHLIRNEFCQALYKRTLLSVFLKRYYWSKSNDNREPGKHLKGDGEEQFYAVQLGSFQTLLKFRSTHLIIYGAIHY